MTGRWGGLSSFKMMIWWRLRQCGVKIYRGSCWESQIYQWGPRPITLPLNASNSSGEFPEALSGVCVLRWEMQMAERLHDFSMLFSKAFSKEEPRSLRHVASFPWKGPASAPWYIGRTSPAFPFTELDRWLALWLEIAPGPLSKSAWFYQHQTRTWLAVLTLNSSGLTQTLSGDDKYNEKGAENNFLKYDYLVILVSGPFPTPLLPQFITLALHWLCSWARTHTHTHTSFSFCI